MSLVVHFEIHASEPQRLIDFYGQLLGWEFTRFGDMPYWGIDTGSGSVRQGEGGAPQAGLGINGGLTQRRGPAPEAGGPVAGANLVVAVDDVDGLFARGLELGGSEALAPDDMPGVGRLAYLVDPDGNVFGLVSPVASDGSVEMGAGAEGASAEGAGADGASAEGASAEGAGAEALDPMNVTPEP